MKSLLFICIFLLAFQTQAQMCPCEFGGRAEAPLRFELGVNTFNINEVTIFNARNKNYRQGLLNGLVLKYHLNLYTVRAGFDYSENSYNYHNVGRFPTELEGKSFGKHFRLGLEKSLSRKKLQPYFALDLVLSSEQFSGSGAYDEIIYQSRDYKYKVNAYGFSPAFGLRYRPVKHFSISAETAMSWIWCRMDSQVAGYKDRSSREHLLNPLRALSLNYHF